MSITRKLTTLISAGLIACMSLTACSGAENTEKTPQDTDKIHAVVFGNVGGEGVLRDNAVTSVAAAKAAVNHVNEMGGIDGKEVEITVIDDTGDPTVAVTKLREMLSDSRPDFVMNSGPSPVVEAITPILSSEKIISFNMAPTPSTSDPSQSPYNFDVAPSVSDLVASLVAEVDNRGFTSAAILHSSSAYGESYGALTEEHLKDMGITSSGNAAYDVAALDMTPQLEGLKSQNPDVLILDAYGAPLGYILEGIEKLGWDVPIMGNTSLPATSLVTNEPPEGVLGTDQVKNLTMQVYSSAAYDETNEPVLQAAREMVEVDDIKASLILACNYDAVLLYKAAVENTSSTDADEIAKALKDEEVQVAASTVIFSKYSFSEDSHAVAPEPSEFSFIPPGPLLEGQFR